MSYFTTLGFTLYEQWRDAVLLGHFVRIVILLARLLFFVPLFKNYSKSKYYFVGVGHDYVYPRPMLAIN